MGAEPANYRCHPDPAERSNPTAWNMGWEARRRFLRIIRMSPVPTEYIGGGDRFESEFQVRIQEFSCFGMRGEMSISCSLGNRGAIDVVLGL
ncbi:MAG: hypothetical protein ACI8QS_003654 [Planctomycetota bacterium]|jgi:hypothetical protein